MAQNYNEALSALQKGDNFTKIYNAAVEELEEAGISEYELETELREFLGGSDFEQTEFERNFIRSMVSADGRLETIETHGLEKEKNKVAERIVNEERKANEKVNEEKTIEENTETIEEPENDFDSEEFNEDDIDFDF